MTDQSLIARAAQAALDAYEDRFESTTGKPNTNYLGPIDDEMKALRAALTREQEAPTTACNFCLDQARQARAERDEAIAQLTAARGQEAQPAHSDDLAVDAFAVAMKAKLSKQRAKGYGGWETCPVERLQRMLVEHVAKGDPVDVANFAMMLSARNEATASEREEDNAARYRYLRSIDSSADWNRLGHYAADALDKMIDSQRLGREKGEQS